MTKEIDASLYSGPAALATAIREAVPAIGVGLRVEVWVKCGKSRHRVTDLSCDAVCRGLLIAAHFTCDPLE